MTLRSRFFAVSVALCAAAGLGCFSPDAHACGGLFCSAANPVNQAAERIVFATNDDGTVTAAIEILYQGPSEKFAWVLPVPAAKVDVAVSSKQAFDALQQASNPQYSLQTSFDPSCPSPPLTATGGLAGSAGPPSAEGDAASPVEVVASGNVGPYDYTQIQVNPDDADPAQAAIDWFTENGYDVGALGPEVLRPYLEQDMNLLAFKLTKGNDTGSIRPVLLNYPGERPVIPIRPTAVAANDDMGILVWVLGSGRAVPTTYFDLQLNDAHINWFSPNATYNDVVSRAADEAGGKGFVTEESGPAGDFAQTIFPDWKEEQFTELRTANFSSMQEFLQMAQSVAQSHFYPSITGFGGPLGDAAVSIGQNQYDGFMDVLSDPDIVPLRDGATPEQLNGCVACYFQEDVAVQNDLYPSTPYDPATDPLLDMDVPAFLDAMEAKVIEPLRATRALFENNAHVTRLYTTMSADEMDIDPEFALNPELEDVSNVHTATRVLQCNGEDWTVRLPDGIEIQGNGSTWPVALDDEEMPFNVRVLQLSTTGEGDVVMDNTDQVLTRLSDLGLTDVVPDVTPGSDPSTPVDSTGPSGPGSVDLQNPDGVDPTTPSDPSNPSDSTSPSDNTTPSDSTTANDPSATDGSSGDPQVVDGNKGMDSQLNDAMEAKTSSGGCAVRAPSGGRPTAPWVLLSLPLGFALARRRRVRR